MNPENIIAKMFRENEFPQNLCVNYKDLVVTDVSVVDDSLIYKYPIFKEANNGYHIGKLHIVGPHMKVTSYSGTILEASCYNLISQFELKLTELQKKFLGTESELSSIFGLSINRFSCKDTVVYDKHGFLTNFDNIIGSTITCSIQLDIINKTLNIYDMIILYNEQKIDQNHIGFDKLLKNSD